MKLKCDKCGYFLDKNSKIFKHQNEKGKNLMYCETCNKKEYNGSCTTGKGLMFTIGLMLLIGGIFTLPIGLLGIIVGIVLIIISGIAKRID